MGKFACNLTPRPRTAAVFPLGVGLLSACILTGCTVKPDGATAQSLAKSDSGLVCTTPTWDLGEVLVKGKAADFEFGPTINPSSRSQRD